MTNPVTSTVTSADQTCPEGTCGHITVNVPEGKEAASDLMMLEIDVASRKLQASAIVAASNPAHMLHSAALIQFALCWAKRADPKAKAETFQSMTLDELHHSLGFHRPDAADEDGEGEDPTSPADEESEPS